MALVASYLINAGSGTTIADGQASPVNLTISTGTGSGWTSITEGAGYDFNQTATAESGNITSSNKIWTAMNDASFTILTVFRNDDQASTTAIWGLREDDFSQSVNRTRLNGDAAGGGNENTIRWFWSPGDNYWQSDNNVVTEGTVYAMAQVFDSNNATAAQRCRVYLFPLGGSMSQLTPDIFIQPTSGQTPDFSTVGNAVLQFASVVGIQPFNGALFYWGLWDEAIDDTTLDDFLGQLLTNNDADPTAGAAAASPPPLSAARRNMRVNAIYRR